MQKNTRRREKRVWGRTEVLVLQRKCWVISGFIFEQGSEGTVLFAIHAGDPRSAWHP